MGVNTRKMYSCLQKCNKLNRSHLVGQSLNSIHDGRTNAYTIFRYVPTSKGPAKKVVISWVKVTQTCWQCSRFVSGLRYKTNLKVSRHDYRDSKSKQRKSNETPTWCNTVQVFFLQGHSTCFGRKRPSSGVFKTSTAATGTCVIVAGQSSHLLIRADRP